MARRHYDLNPTPDNFRALWDKLHDLTDQLTTAQGTITKQAATLVAQATSLTSVQQQATQALITAGKMTGTSPTNAGTGAGSGGGSAPSGDSHPNYYSLVVEAKSDLITEGADLTGPCGAYLIVQRAVQYIAPSDPAVGLLDKPSGNNCSGYATDIICFNDGLIYDVLIDGGGANTPAWSFSGSVDPSRYRPPT